MQPLPFDPYLELTSKLPTWDLAHKHIFLRADLNISDEHHFRTDLRFQALLPTLTMMVEKKGHITLATRHASPSVIRTALQEEGLSAGIEIITDPDAYTPSRPIDYYVDDAFGSVHRASNSLTVLPTMFDKNHRTIGLLIEKEIRDLSRLKHKEERFVLIVGGGKAAEKVQSVIGMCAYVSDILICPAYQKYLPELLKAARLQGVSVHEPIDYLVGKSWNGPYSYKTRETITSEELVISVGPKTVAQWQPIIRRAQTIFFNGPMGDLSKPETTQELHAVLQTVAQTPAWRAIGGGNSVAALQLFGLQSQVDYCSTGGGSALAYLGNRPLPALDVLL